MSSAAATDRLRPYLAGLAFGAWAAAIALAPSLPMKTALAAPALAVPAIWWILLHPHRWIAPFFATALLLPPLPVAIGDSGPHVCLVFAALGLFAGMLRMSDWRLDLSGPGAPLVALAGVLLASVAMAALYSGAVAAAGSLARVALFGISVYLFFYPRGGGIGIRALYWIAVVS